MKKIYGDILKIQIVCSIIAFLCIELTLVFEGLLPSNDQRKNMLGYEKDKVLSEVAEKRLKAIKEFTEFGSGFKIAMRDLEIRGAGNILGSQQHGHMAVIGYDLYVKMLNDAIRKVKGELIVEDVEVEIDVSVNAYIPDYYIDDEFLTYDEKLDNEIVPLNSLFDKEEIKNISDRGIHLEDVVQKYNKMYGVETNNKQYKKSMQKMY